VFPGCRGRLVTYAVRRVRPPARPHSARQLGSRRDGAGMGGGDRHASLSGRPASLRDRGLRLCDTVATSSSS